MYNTENSYLHLNEFLTAHYITYASLQYIYSIHLTFVYFVLCTPIYRLTEIIHVLCTKPSVWNGRCDNSYVLGLLVHGNVVVFFW